MSISTEQETDLVDKAKRASLLAYSDYSKFPVGAAVLCEDGSVYTGANIENASYGQTMCAERVAVFKAVSEGKRALKCIAVYTPTESPTPPCGACRQVIREFAPNCKIVCVCDGPQKLDTSLAELLPHSFGPDQLK